MPPAFTRGRLRIKVGGAGRLITFSRDNSTVTSIARRIRPKGVPAIGMNTVAEPASANSGPSNFAGPARLSALLRTRR